jgi:hypothetical protein
MQGQAPLLELLHRSVPANLARAAFLELIDTRAGDAAHVSAVRRAVNIHGNSA